MCRFSACSPLDSREYERTNQVQHVAAARMPHWSYQMGPQQEPSQTTGMLAGPCYKRHALYLPGPRCKVLNVRAGLTNRGYAHNTGRPQKHQLACSTWMCQRPSQEYPMGIAASSQAICSMDVILILDPAAAFGHRVRWWMVELRPTIDLLCNTLQGCQGAVPCRVEAPAYHQTLFGLQVRLCIDFPGSLYQGTQECCPCTLPYAS